MRFDSFAQLETIADIENTLMPKLVGFATEIGNMETLFGQMCENVRKLDEDVQMKANKVSLTLLKEQISQNYVSKEVHLVSVETYEQLSEQVAQSRAYLNEQFKTFLQDHEDAIGSVI